MADDRATDAARLADEDRKLVDLVMAVLVDPNLHTDTRMRLQHEITTLLRATHEDGRRTTPVKPAAPPAAPLEGHAAELLEAVLVDPSLHTELRMRLHREIREMLARHGATRVTT